MPINGGNYLTTILRDSITTMQPQRKLFGIGHKIAISFLWLSYRYE